MKTDFLGAYQVLFRDSLSIHGFPMAGGPEATTLYKNIEVTFNEVII
jgi:hypothetical protein